MGGEPQVKLDLVSAEKNTLRVEMKELKERLRDTESARCAPKPSSPLWQSGAHGGCRRLFCRLPTQQYTAAGVCVLAASPARQTPSAEQSRELGPWASSSLLRDRRTAEGAL